MGTFKLLTFVHSSDNCSTTEYQSVNNLETSLPYVNTADTSYCTVSDLFQLDGNVTLFDDSQIRQDGAELEPNLVYSIPVHISEFRNEEPSRNIRRIPTRKTIKRSNILLQSMELPVVMNLNPRSIYNKTEDLYVLLEQYQAEVICISESWEREDLPLKQLLDLENFEILTNVKQRDFKGGKPAILVNKEKFHVKPLCPEPITVPVGVEAVWALITPKSVNKRSRAKYIAIGSIYYRGPKSTKKEELFDHIAQTFHLLSAKYGSDIQFIIAGDTNRLNLTPITSLSPYLKQLVQVPTRLNPDAILDPIITTLGKWYLPPITKPPINPNEGDGKPSDHLVVLMLPLASSLDIQPRQYRTVTTRPITQSGIDRFGQWIVNEKWSEVYQCQEVNKKVEMFQHMLIEKYYQCFPVKVMKVCDEDDPWMTVELKKLDRKRKREFLKHNRSPKWETLNDEFLEQSSIKKQIYYENIVSDLKLSNPGKWFSKLKRMSGMNQQKIEKIMVDELVGLDDKQQAERIAEHYSSISNQYDQVKSEDFSQYKNADRLPYIEPFKVYQTINSMNKKAATIPGDLPIKLFVEFAVEISFPLADVINSCMAAGVYPTIFKQELVTPVPKVFPPERLKDLRKISGLLNLSKITDKILGEFLIKDMSASRDPSQYGNEKKVSRHHYLIKLLNKILTAVDKNSQKEAFAVIVHMIDWSQAFDRLSHKLGIESFLKNGVRHSLIPILVSFFQNRSMKVKWNGETSSSRVLNGGGPQGGLMGILEYLSQTNDNTESIPVEDRFKFIDDLSILEIINLICLGLSSFNCKLQVPSDINVEHGQYLPPQNTHSVGYLKNICDWTDEHQMQLNADKSKFMVVNFTEKYQFNTRFQLDNTLLSQVSETRLLGVILRQDLTWTSNTDFLVKQAYKRMLILHRLFEFEMPIHEMTEIYTLYVRSILESSAVVWHSSLTQEEEIVLERVQKVALRIILNTDYDNYENALSMTGLTTLKERRVILCQKFAINCTKSERTQDMFPLNPSHVDTRHHGKYLVQAATTSRLRDSAIPYMQRLLNGWIK